jgi:hypothetical protein
LRNADKRRTSGAGVNGQHTEEKTMATSNGAFTLTINTNASFGETGRPHTERAQIRRMLMKVAQDVGSGRPSSAIIDESGNNVGSYSYGAGTICAGN